MAAEISAYRVVWGVNKSFESRRGGESCRDVHSTLLPRMKQSPYLCFSSPLTYSSVCENATHMCCECSVGVWGSLARGTVTCLFHRNVHEAIQACQHATIVHPGVQLHSYRTSNHQLQKVRRGLFFLPRAAGVGRRRSSWLLTGAPVISTEEALKNSKKYFSITIEEASTHTTHHTLSSYTQQLKWYTRL